MSGKPVARVGDTGSHGGSITTGSNSFFVNSKPIARVGDIYDCPEHGPNPIVTGASHVFGQGYLVAHIGSKTACGAIIVSGSPDTFVEEPSPMKTHSIGALDTYSETFDECFQFIDEDTQEHVRNMPYRIECDGVISYSGYTDDYGKTLRVYT